MQKKFRTHYISDISASIAGLEVVLSGWVKKIRDHGGLLFMELWDKTGRIQVVVDKNTKDAEKTKHIKLEYVIQIKGMVTKRPEGTFNLAIALGDIEIHVKSINVLNTCNTTPFLIEDELEVQENLRLTYRYLDLRRPKMMKNLAIRHKVMQAARSYLSSNGFIEVETPILTKSTPEGARDFLVPSRLTKGLFYALPQSPQLFKQLLMVAGLDRYFQIARCFRDEDLRADRQPEFSQIDVEASFLSMEEFIGINEGLIEAIFSAVGVSIQRPFKRLKYDVAMSEYGTDNPDVRFGLKLKDMSASFKETKFMVFRQALGVPGGVLKGFNAKDQGSISLKEKVDIEDIAKDVGLMGLTFVKREGEELKGKVTKYFTEAEKASIIEELNMEEGDLGVIACGPKPKVHAGLSQIRLYFRDVLNLASDGDFTFLWITDFPLFEYSQQEQRIVSMHHPFTAPMDEDIDMLEKNPMSVRAKAYDIVLNGNEIGGGSMRIYNTDVQERVFAMLNLSKEEVREKFGFLLEALGYGAPPHGGIAYGLDRIIALLVKASSIRDVIAFPKTQRGLCPLSFAPSQVSNAQLEELGIALIGSRGSGFDNKNL